MGQMSDRSQFTRRELALGISAAAVAAAQAPATAPLPTNAEDELKAVKESFQQNMQQLAKFDLPMFVEPAVHFKA